VGRVTQKRSSDKYAAVLGQGKLAELARWTGGSGKIESAFERPKHKAASKFEAEDPDVTEESDDDESDDTIEASPALANRRRSSSWTVICRRPN
jgi:GTP-binding protein HflX